MISEYEYKIDLILRLNQQGSGWIDGDVESNHKNKADVVNHVLKIAIEIKDESGSPDGLKKTNQQYGDHLRSANKKFKEYPKYKTILLIRGNADTIPGIVYYAIEGIDSYSKIGNQLIYSGTKNKYSPYIRKEIGCFLILADKYYYFPNKHALPQRIINKQEVENILGQNV